jgi:MFS family permease
MLTFRKQTGNTNLYSSAIQYVIFLVTTGCVLPFIDRIGRRTLLLIGAVSSMILHYSIAAIMATQVRKKCEKQKLLVM